MNKYLYTLSQIIREDYPGRVISADKKISSMLNESVEKVLWRITAIKLELTYGFEIPDQLLQQTELTFEEFTDELSRLPLISDKLYPAFHEIKWETLRLSKKLVSLEGKTDEESTRKLSEINRQIENLDLHLKTAKRYSDPTIIEGQICPNCGSKDIIFIAYGLVDPDDFDQEVLLGGCILDEGSPNVACKNCEHGWIIERNKLN